VTSTATLDKIKVFSSICKNLAWRGLLLFLKFCTRLAVNPAISRTWSVAGFAAYAFFPFFWRLNNVTSFFTKSVYVTANTILVLGVILGGIKFCSLFRLDLLIRFELIDRLSVRGFLP
jgi:hypothetical protein